MMIATDNPIKPLQTSTLSEYEILECLPFGLVILNAKGIVIWFNGAATELLGSGLAGAIWLEVVQKAFAPRADDGHQVSLVDGRRVNVVISPLHNLPGELVSLTDLTTTREYEQEKANQRHLAVIGKMTAQLAHQIRTPLSSAMLYTEHLISHPDCHDKHELWLARIVDCHLSIEQQIQDLLLFARGDTIERVAINLRQWAKRLEQRAQSLVQTIPLLLQFDNQLPSVDYYLHEESFMGALLNLISNALQTGASCITITMQYTKNDGFLLRVADNGCGMSEYVKAKAFTPFFTSKTDGTGLGLAVVYEVVKNHGGEVSIESSPGKGCCVTINLP